MFENSKENSVCPAHCVGQDITVYLSEIETEFEGSNLPLGTFRYEFTVACLTKQKQAKNKLEYEIILKKIILYFKL